MSPEMPPEASPPIYGLVLGGGRSRRMGVDKATLQYHGRPQLAVAYDLIAPHCARTFVGIRPEQAGDPLFAAFPCLVDAYPGEGPLAAVVSAQAQHPGAAWLVVACDLPFLDGATLSDLLARRDRHRHATAYLSAHDGLIEPMCTLYEPTSAPLLAKAYAEGLRCARKGLASVNPLGLDLPSPQALENANTPADREAFMTQITSKPTKTRVRLHFYAQLREALGRFAEAELALPVAEAEVLRQLGVLYPTHRDLLARCRIAVNDAYLLAGEAVPQVAELDIIAPVSGG